MKLLSTCIVLSTVIACSKVQAFESLELGSTKAFTYSPVTLKAESLALLDGIPGLIDEHKIHDIIYIGRAITQIQAGSSNKSGKYSYNGKLYTLHQLVALEKENKNQLKGMVPVVIADFEKVTSPFLAKAQGTKHFMIKLIAEWCSKAGRSTSGLLEWAHLNSGSEKEVFHRSIKTLQDLDTFCDDLLHFLKDLVRSCPKARDRYDRWRAQHKSPIEQPQLQ
ncbi:hypothetical protein H0X48_04890 [Candidatus Dependentiae bacterium]|nr:hypothetical protein [Candidatus Dependentiae bacterium]